MSDGRQLARNSVLNLLGLGLPLIVAVVAIPPLVRGLGAERFGLLTLAWAAIGYFSLFELGLSRALTQSIAQRLGQGEGADLAALTWSALFLLVLLGCIAGALVAGLTPVLVTRALNVPRQLQHEAIVSFYILAASLPFVLLSVGLRGVLEAHQHFGAASALRVLLVVFMFVGPLLALPLSRSLVPAVAILAVGRAIGSAAHLAICVKRYAFMRSGVVLQHAPLKPLLRFGGWTTVTNVVSPMMVLLDRFLIGALLPIAAVAHYVTPYEIVVKLLVIPAAVVGAMFPAFAALFTSDAERTTRLYERALRFVVLVMFPIVLVAITWAHEGLTLWIGPILPLESAIVLRWLAVGVFINAIGQVPFAALQGAGRPDIVAKLHLMELPLYVLGIFVLVHAYGLSGAAIAWTLRVALDTTVLLTLSQQKLGFGLAFGVSAPSLALILLTFALAAVVQGQLAKVLFLLAAIALFVPLSWRLMLTASERAAVWGTWRRHRISPRPEGTV